MKLYSMLIISLLTLATASTIQSAAAADNAQPECPICLEKKDLVPLHNAHSFCLPCIQQALVFTPNCPLCREPISPQRCQKLGVTPEQHNAAITRIRVEQLRFFRDQRLMLLLMQFPDQMPEIVGMEESSFRPPTSSWGRALDRIRQFAGLESYTQEAIRLLRNRIEELPLEQVNQYIDRLRERQRRGRLRE